MNNEETKKKSFLKKIAEKTEETGKKVIATVKDKTQAISEEKQMKRYNPLFPEEYKSEAFHLPNLIIIADDAVRKDIAVCEGAMGWIRKEKDVEALYLYDEEVESSGLQFLPAAVCDTAYYVDPHDRSRFISVDSYFSNMQEEKLAELQHIAYSLGAQRYWVEMQEEQHQSKQSKQAYTAKGVKGKAADLTLSAELSAQKGGKSQAVAKAVFVGKRKPVKPKLCWFAHDRNVLNLIDMLCDENAPAELTGFTIELSSANYSTMSVSTAEKISVAVGKMGLSCNFAKKSQEEHSQKMFFRLEF